MAAEISPDVLDGYRTTLKAFVLRARRVESHSLLADLPAFIRWAHGSANLTMTGGAGEMRFNLPNEELFESLAARVRPLLLEEDGLHFGRVLAALGAFGRGDDDVMAKRDVLRSAWERATGPTPIGFQIGEAVDGAPLIADVSLAHAWLYGDLVHAKPNVPAAVLRSSLDQRYLAAVLIYGQAALATVATLNVVRLAAERGLVELDEETLQTTPVVVSDPMITPVSAARIRKSSELTGFASAPPATDTD